MIRISDEERRRRLAVRHALAPGHQVESPAAASAMTVLHATEPATVYLSCRARCPSVTIADVGRALHEERSLVKQMAMRRTVFDFPRDLLPAAWGSAAARVAAAEQRAMAKDVVKAGLASDGDAWLETARDAALDVLADPPDGMTAAEIRRAAPVIDVKVSVSAHYRASREPGLSTS